MSLVFLRGFLNVDNFYLELSLHCSYLCVTKANDMKNSKKLKVELTIDQYNVLHSVIDRVVECMQKEDGVYRDNGGIIFQFDENEMKALNQILTEQL